MSGKRSEPQGGAYRPSLMFAILAGLALIIFAAAMAHLATFPTPEEKRQAQFQQIEDERLKSDATRQGISVQQVLENDKKNKDHAGLIRELRKDLQLALQSLDDSALDTALDGASAAHVEEAMPYVYDRAVGYNNPHALGRLIDVGIPCDYASTTGRYAFDAAIKSTSDVHLKKLLERECDRIPEDLTTEISSVIRNSKHKHRLLLLPNANVSIEEKNSFLMSAINRGSTDLALYLLENGASPHAVARNGTESALGASMRKNKPIVSLKLIELGADTGELPSGVWALSTALSFGHMDVARQIMTREPEYIRSNDLDENLMAGVFFEVSNQTHTRLKFLIENGVTIKALKDSGIRYLIKAIEAGDVGVVRLLLQGGANPRQRDNVQTALGVAKKGSGAKADEIVNLLLEFDATDDLLALVRAEKNIDSTLACSLGRRVVIDLDGIAKAHELKLTVGPIGQIDGCSGLLAGCLNQGFGADDCMRSAPACLGADTQTPCCPTNFRDRYFAARCSSLTVFETMQWLEQTAQH